jgi:hypothetical protein
MAKSYFPNCNFSHMGNGKQVIQFLLANPSLEKVALWGPLSQWQADRLFYFLSDKVSQL